jgi:hypothetical protein
MIRDLIKRVQDESRCPALARQMDDETLDFLEVSCTHLSSQGQAKVRGVFHRDTADKVESTICELVVHELLLRLGLSPDFQPRLDGKTPDLRFVAWGQDFLADVFVKHTPTRTLSQESDLECIRDEGETAKSIRDDLVAKASKYAELGYPLVLLVFFGDQRLTPFNLLQALFDEYYEVDSEGRPSRIRWGVYWEEVPDVSEQVRRALSAVVACNWFHPVDRQCSGSRCTGRRLQCVVVHNCRAATRLPIAAFGQFPQFICPEGDFESMEWAYSSTVANLPAKKGIEFEVYQ